MSLLLEAQLIRSFAGMCNSDRAARLDQVRQIVQRGRIGQRAVSGFPGGIDARPQPAPPGIPSDRQLRRHIRLGERRPPCSSRRTLDWNVSVGQLHKEQRQRDSAESAPRPPQRQEVRCAVSSVSIPLRQIGFNTPFHLASSPDNPNG